MEKACSEFVVITQPHFTCPFWTNHRIGHFHFSLSYHLCLISFQLFYKSSVQISYFFYCISNAASIHAEQMRVNSFAQGSNSSILSVVGFSLTTFQAVIEDR